MKPVIERCGKKAERPDELFKKVIPPGDASWAERYLKAVKILGKGGSVETLMHGMLQDVQLLASNYGMKTVTTEQIEQITKALKDVSKSRHQYLTPNSTIPPLQQAKKPLRKSQLNYLEVLDRLMQSSGTVDNPMLANLRQKNPEHWTTFRYNDWNEPREWHSDHLSFLVAIGMTRAVIEKIQESYKPSLKPGRPLLLYAISLAHPVSTTDLEKDAIDPDIVEGLFKRGCNPNQLPPNLTSIRGAKPEPIVWQSGLIALWMRLRDLRGN